ncbi:MAG: cysteinyl-tRNA synthetase [Solirubrobacteraceae bacterium]|jgi:cysteinyl-tRNA synthetase|nr:cysteinyl-tRNA synthetase [Solirubrobacteraceae bacterium]
MRAISLQDTLSGERRPLETRVPGQVGVYACGPTVYGRVHVGNARPFVVFSVLKRFLEHEGLDVTLVVNVTDVNDKIYDAAREAGVGSEQLAREMTAAYVADTDALGLGRPDHEPLASETMGPIVELIGDLVEGGHAYAADGDVYFRVRSYPRYGELSHRSVDAMDQGEGVEGAARKEDPLDFALWKGAKAEEDTAWDSPWGRGRPGWHIECSAMAEQLLGVNFEIHGGGSDLVFPHHENEAAQTRAARGEPLARLWMHNGMVELDDAKMAKSVGNIALLHVALEQFGRDALLMYFLGGHYRQPLAFSGELLEEAGARVNRVRNALGNTVEGPSPGDMAPLKERFFAALANDFNTPAALAALFDWIREANRRGEGVGDADLREMLGVLGLEDLEALAATGDPAASDPEAGTLLEQREAARARRDFEAADRLRDEIGARGWEIRDGPDGPELIPAGR